MNTVTSSVSSMPRTAAKKDVRLGEENAYHAHRGGKGPGIILIEEIWGVNDNIRSIADRFADEGYSVLAPELLPPGVLEKLTPDIQKDLFDPEKRTAVQPALREAMAPIMQPEFAAGALQKLKEAIDYLLAHESCNGNIAVVGFCFGGTYSFLLAARDPRIKAAVPFYGQPPSEDDAASISCPVLAFYGEKDEMLMQSLPKLKEDMHKGGTEFEAVVYQGAGHAFFNDTNPVAYREDAAKDAWKKTLAFLSAQLH